MDDSFPWNRIVGSGEAPWAAPAEEHHFFEIQRTKQGHKRIEVSATELAWEGYLPLKSQISLHRNFAALPSRVTNRFVGELMRFVYWFGFLENEYHKLGYGEYLDFWHEEVKLMQAAVRAYDQNELVLLLVNQKLADHCAPTLTPDDGLTITPTNLLGVMWLEFASATDRRVNGPKAPVFRQCLVCSRYYEQARRDQKFCTHACKMKQYRTRTGR